MAFPSLFWNQRPVWWKPIFPQTPRFQGDSSTWHLPCTWFLLLLHQLHSEHQASDPGGCGPHLRASGVRSRRLRTPPQSIRRQIPDAADPTSDHQASDPRGCGPLLYEDVNFCPILFFPKFTLANTDSMPEFHFLFHRFLYVYIGKPIDCPLWFLSLFLSADHPLLETC